MLGRPLEATVVPTAFNTTRETQLAVGFCLVAFELVRTSAINSTGALSAGRALSYVLGPTGQAARPGPQREAPGPLGSRGLLRDGSSHVATASTNEQDKESNVRGPRRGNGGVSRRRREQKRGSLSPQEW